MTFTKENLDIFFNNAPKSKLCSDEIFVSFFSTLLRLNFDNLDQEKSKIDMCDQNGKLYKFELEDLKKDKDELPPNISYYIELVSINNKSLKLIYIFWKNQENSYLGQEEVQYADDADIRNKSDLIEFKKQLNMLLLSKIDEDLFFKDGKLQKYKYQFHNEQHSPVIFSNNYQTLFSRKVDLVETNTYEPWIELL